MPIKLSTSFRRASLELVNVAIGSANIAQGFEMPSPPVGITRVAIGAAGVVLGLYSALDRMRNQPAPVPLGMPGGTNQKPGLDPDIT